MKEKIEWYKEVLALEPGSRIFFPLAKLLAAEGEINDAVLTLQQGLGRHPDHVEARLMLVELLAKRDGPDGSVGREVDDLGKLLAAYPAFWQSWGDRLSADPAMHEASLALRFFAQALEGKEMDWVRVIEKGILALMAESAGESAGPAPRAPAHVANLDAVQRIRSSVSVKAVPEPQTEAAKARRHVSIALSPPEKDHGQRPEAPAAVAHAAAGESENDDAVEDDQSDEAVSLRTRTMAEVLAEQGDYAAAADIYQELAREADADAKADLEARHRELLAQGGTPLDTAEPEADAKPQDVPVESARLVNLLESLAQRLEERAH
jgi:tetratricopeptide (TPR) repeat protein